MVKSLKILAWTAALLVAGVLAAGAGLIAYNNRDVDPPGTEELSAALDAAIGWLEKNEKAVGNNLNPVLWYMLQRTAEIVPDRRVHDLFSRYYEKIIVPARRDHLALYHPWVPLFEPGTWVPVRFEDIRRLPDYNWHFVYAIGCDEELGQIPDIARQNDPGFCGAFHLFKPACTTHQLLGIRLMQRRRCGDKARLESVASRLQQRIVNQLQLDPRVVDVYLQRVLMLVESGRPDLVKPVWLRQVLDAQQADGGWGNFQALVPVGGGDFLGFGAGGGRFDFYHLVSTGKARSTFHATTQGVFLLALLVR